MVNISVHGEDSSEIRSLICPRFEYVADVLFPHKKKGIHKTERIESQKI